MSREFHIIAVEMPGAGKTSCDPSRDLHIMGHVERLKQFLRLLKLDSDPVCLAGAATGGTVIGCFAAIYPDIVAKLMLICPAMRSPVDSDMIKMVKAGVDPGLVPKEPADILTSVQLLSKSPSNISKQILKGLFELKKPTLNNSTELAMNMLEDIWNGKTDVLLSAHIKDIAAPTFVVWGQYDRVIHVSGADVLRENLQHCVGVEILPCGHAIYMDEPRKLSVLLENFIRRND